MLKPQLARGELRCIGATTLDEYRKHIEKDAALERRFQPVLRRRADASRTRSPILRGLKETLRGPPRRARSRTARSSPRRRCRTATSPTASCPDKAIDLVDEAASRLRMEIDSHADGDRRSSTGSIMQLEIERDGARQGEGRRPQRRGSPKLETELAEPAGEGRRDCSAQWQTEKAGIGGVQRGQRADRAGLRRELEPAQRARRPRARPPSSQYGAIPDLQRQLAGASRPAGRRRRRSGCCARR
jgi:ATP-dependent Clp protease ATP-binding subunit ClpB